MFHNVTVGGQQHHLNALSHVNSVPLGSIFTAADYVNDDEGEELTLKDKMSH